MDKKLPYNSSFNSKLAGGAPPPYDQASSLQGFQSPVPNLISGTSTLLSIYAYGNCGLNPSSQLQTPVYRGTNTSVEPEYVSERAKRSSGNAVLRHVSEGGLLGTTYRFGLAEPHIIRLEADEDRKELRYGEGTPIVNIKSHWFSSSVTLITEPDGRAFEWRYMRTEVESKKKRVLALSSGDSGADEERVLAVFLRTNDTRTPGTSKWDAGNGGQLIVSSEALACMDEALIIATCIMMLKKEMDRSRSATAAVVS